MKLLTLTALDTDYSSSLRYPGDFDFPVMRTRLSRPPEYQKAVGGDLRGRATPSIGVQLAKNDPLWAWSMSTSQRRGAARPEDGRAAAMEMVHQSITRGEHVLRTRILKIQKRKRVDGYLGVRPSVLKVANWPLTNWLHQDMMLGRWPKIGKLRSLRWIRYERSSEKGVTTSI